MIVLLLLICAMPRTRSFNKEEVLSKATALFWEQGFERTSMADLFGVMRISRQSLYNTFGSKRLLFEAALQQYGQRFIDNTLAPMESAGADVETIREYFRALPQALIVKANRMGCLYVNSASEFGGLDKQMDRHSGAFYRRIRNAFTNVLENERGRGWEPKQDITMLAPLLVSVSYGMIIISKSGATELELGQAAESAVQLLI